jgi:hypothetical protein
MAAYGRGGQRAAGLGAIERLARLYWYTVEFGLMRGPEGLQIYGAGIVSSFSETLFALDDPSPNRIGFDLKRLMRTNYRIDDFQQSYFVIDSFEDLLRQTIETDFAPLYAELHGTPDLAVDAIEPDDRIYHRGTQQYARSRPSQTGIPIMSHDNPLGLDGFAFCEFTSPEPEVMERQLRQLGFTLAAEHDAGRLRLYRQGRIAFVVNTLPAGQAAQFRKLHGPSANGMAFRGRCGQGAWAGAGARRHQCRHLDLRPARRQGAGRHRRVIALSGGG